MKPMQLYVQKGEYDVELHINLDNTHTVIAIDPDKVDTLCLMLIHVKNQLVPEQDFVNMLTCGKNDKVDIVTFKGV